MCTASKQLSKVSSSLGSLKNVTGLIVRRTSSQIILHKTIDSHANGH